MQLIRFSNSHDFYAEVKDHLLTQEAQNGLPLGLLSLLNGDNSPYQDPYMALIEDDSQIYAVAIRTPPYGVVIGTPYQLADGMLQLLVTDLTSLYGHDVPTVSGEKAISRAFARAWTLQTHQPHALLMGQRIYQLDAVIPPKDVTGNLRQATEADREHLIDWVIAFSAITPQGEMTRPHAAAQIDRYLGVTGDVSGVFVWEVDGMPVSMAASVRPTENGSCVGMVYTPPEFRRKGYASAVTAGVSQHILNSGKRFACLYTDLGNPTSNHIYQEIGYYPVLDVDMYSLNDNT